MSRHNSSRRKSYGRRQHEVHERSHREHDRRGLRFELDPFASDAATTDFGVFDSRMPAPRLRFALGD